MLDYHTLKRYKTSKFTEFVRILVLSGTPQSAKLRPLGLFCYLIVFD